METILKHYSHKIGINYWHFEWCTKYRYNMMKREELKNLVAASIRKAATENNIKIHILKVLPDHGHMVATLPNNMTDSKARMLLKGRSAYLIFRNREHVRLRYPRGQFGSAGSCAITVGYNDLDSITKYIENQEEHHGLSSC
ncbi:IS200/IS605 family transposase [Candidatus Woesearchaeota archaeon]|nr:IS200/IS605 family transposase [Candidatus Woesearchaeota archaeon]